MVSPGKRALVSIVRVTWCSHTVWVAGAGLRALTSLGAMAAVSTATYGSPKALIPLRRALIPGVSLATRRRPAAIVVAATAILIATTMAVGTDMARLPLHASHM